MWSLYEGLEGMTCGTAQEIWIADGKDTRDSDGLLKDAIWEMNNGIMHACSSLSRLNALSATPASA